MALFKILKGKSANLPSNKVNGYCYVTTDEHKFYVDYTKDNGTLDRFALNAVSADQWKTARNLNGMIVNGTSNVVNYGICSTAMSEKEKVVSCSNFQLIRGAEITVKFTAELPPMKSNTIAKIRESTTLNVNNTGAKNIQYRGRNIYPEQLAEDKTYTFRYNGSEYDLVGDLDTNDIYLPAGDSFGLVKSGGDVTISDGIITINDDSHNHIISNIDGLQTALNGKAASSHTHNYAGSASAGGPANSAVKATQDSDGSQINTTYVKKSGSTMSNLNALLAGTSTTTNISPNIEAIASSPFARDLWHDHFAFLSGGHTIIDHQITIDGNTWENSTLDLTPLFMQKEEPTLTILSTTELARRFTIYCTGTDLLRYSMIVWYEIGVGFTNPFSKFEVCIERSNDNNTWSEVHRSTIDVSAKPYFLRGVNLDGDHRYLRFTFTKTTNITTGSVNISCIKAYTSRKADQGRGIEYEYPYDWNANRDIFPHSDNGRFLGLPNKKWKTVYATTFDGSLSGNASTATKLATARTIALTGSVTGSGTFDGSGNLSIATTTSHNHDNNYVKKSGDTMTGNLTVPTVIGNLNGNANSASKVNNKLTIGSKTFDGSAAVTIAASDLGLASAMLFLGTTTTAITDGATTNPVTIGGASKTVTAGNVVLYGNKEFAWTGSAWEELGNEGSYKIVQAAVADPSASGTSNTFIATISQDANGKITATKKTVAVTNNAPTLSWGTTSTIGSVAGTNLQVKMPANPNTDTKVTQTVTTSNAAYPLLLAPNGQTATATTTSYFDSGVTLNPSTNTITANINGNATTATKLATARKIGLSGGVTGTATNFDGSSDITIPVTAVDPSKISSGYTTQRIYINTHPENKAAIIPFINNDIAFLLKRGGSAVVKVDGVIDSSDFSAVFDGSPSYWSPSLYNGKFITNGVTNVTVELTLPTEFKYTSTIYIDSGANVWRAKNITVEVMNSKYSNDTWTIKGSVTNHNLAQYNVMVEHTPKGATSTVAGFNKIKITFSNWNNDGFRIAAIGIINFNSGGLRETFLPRDGGELYGSLSPYSNNTNSLGTSNKKWNAVYATTFNGSLSGNASTATKLATARTIALTGSVTGSGTFDGSGNLSIITTTNHTHNYAGSSSAGGSANSAVKLDTTTAGSTTQPVYFTDGKPKAISYTIAKSVPSNAVFTDINVRQKLYSSNYNLPLLMSYQTNTNTTAEVDNVTFRNNSIYANPSTGMVAATSYKISEHVNLQYDSTNECLNFVFA